MIDRTWIENRCKNLPRHDGKNVEMMRRTLDFLQQVVQELEENKLDELDEFALNYKIEMQDGLRRLEERIKKYETLRSIGNI